ncbi:MAG: peptidylprolyl isomerase, partial [Pseudomonadota bacterium]
PLSASPDGFLWYEVADIEDERARTLDEIRERVAEDWTIDERNRLLDEAAESVVAELDGGGVLGSIAEESGYTLTTKFGLDRRTDDPEFGRAGVRSIFSVGPDANGFVQSVDGERRFVYRLTAVTDPLETPADENLEDLVAQGLANDLFQQSIIKLQDEFPVSVNQQAISLALGQ